MPTSAGTKGFHKFPGGYVALLSCMLLVLTALDFGGQVMAQTSQNCNAGTPLQQNDPTSGQTTDLVVNGLCTVVGSTDPNNPTSYYFRNVNIINAGSLNFNDAQIAFYAENIVIENGGAMIAGTPKPIGDAGGQLTIHLWGKSTDTGVTCNSTNCGIPNPPLGTNTYSLNPPQCKASGLPGSVNDCFYDYQTLDGDTAGAYFGHKVLALSYGGTLQLFGKKGATYGTTPTGCADPDNTASCTGTSWVRLAKDALPGDMSLQVAGPVDWKKGDNIILTTTDYLPGHSEQLTLSQDAGSPSNNITTLSLTSAVTYPHNGQLFDLSAASTKLGPNFPKSGDMRAAVGLLTRNIRIVSDGNTPGAPFTATPGNYFGGHTIVRQGFNTYQVQGVEFYQLGQGGSIMHYPVHFHMDRTTPAGTSIMDSSVWDSMTRWMVIHGTQGLMLARNVGYASIGHGYYLEDGTETGNKLYANLGVFARAAVANNPTTANPQNPRMVPGILTATDPICAANPSDPSKCPVSYGNFPFYSDSDNPSVFWIMNGMNDFQYDMAAGAGTCGACYWFVPGAISGPSQMEKWFGYASEQLGSGRAGLTPLQNFVGNSCSTAQEGFIEIGPANACGGVNQRDPAKIPPKAADAMLYMLPSPTAGAIGDTSYWPITSGLRIPTRCKDADSGGSNADCSSVAICAAGNEANCDVVVLNKFTTAFNWPDPNFAAVWLRQLWTLFVNSVVSDPQNAGINLVTSGGYDTSSVFPGYWGLVRQTAMIGSSQWQNKTSYTDGLASNPYTSNAGPFNPFTATIGNSAIAGLQCAKDPISGAPNNAYCMSQADGVSFPVGGFGGFQRLFSVYDGPIYQDTNAYLNIHTTFLTKDGTATGGVLDTKSGPCKPSDVNGNPCQDAGFINAGVPGLRAYKVDDASKNRCYEPNAAIGWKQPNGFYYAPAFHSRSLFFDSVDIRHFVTEPVFTKDRFSFKTNLDAAKTSYCFWNDAIFQGFTDIDRETVLNDDDGTLTGLTSPIAPPGPTATPTPAGFTTISVNKENFFDAPTEAWECASDFPTDKNAAAPRCLPASAKTSPYEYVTTAIYPECAKTAPPPPMDGSPGFCPNTTPSNAWGSVCTSSPPNFGCLGVPIYRQLLNTGETPDPINQLKRMMGQNNFQRSALTVNHGVYYIDTTVSKGTQVKLNFTSPTSFIGGGLYDLFFVYSKPSTQQTYQLFIGKKLDESIAKTNVKFGYEGLTLPFIFTPASMNDADSGAWDSRYNPNTGILTLTTNMSKLASIYSLSATIPDSNPETTLGKQYCQPATMCSFSNNRCQCIPNGPYSALCNQTNPPPNPLSPVGPTVCDWSLKDLDCPAPGCPAFQITFPPPCAGGNNEGCFAPDDDLAHRPPPGTFSGADFTYFEVDFNLANEDTAGGQCFYGTKQPATVNKCPAVK